MLIAHLDDLWHWYLDFCDDYLSNQIIERQGTAMYYGYKSSFAANNEYDDSEIIVIISIESLFLTPTTLVLILSRK